MQHVRRALPEWKLTCLECSRVLTALGGLNTRDAAMNLARLNKHSFARGYEEIGYLFNELTSADMVLDECGAVFLAEIGREPVNLAEAAQRIAAQFADADHTEVERDLRELVVALELGGFVLTGDTGEEMDRKEPSFSYAAPPNVSSEAEEEEHAPSSEVLKKHFRAHPRPFSVQIELTSFCNLRCIHCYLGDTHPMGGLQTDQVYGILDQLKALGALQVSFTGGEIFSRKDLPAILRHARQNDFSITLLTNNTLLSDSLISEFRQTRVRLVKISLYSMQPEIHDAITAKPGSWQMTVRNIERLVAHDVPVQISCPVMKQNIDSFAAVMRWGERLGVNVKPDLLLTARADLSRENLDHRLSLGECQGAIGTIIATDDEYRTRMAREYGINNRRSPDDHLCGVGVSTISIGANGDLYPCPVFPLKLGNVAKSPIREVWEQSLPLHELRGVRFSDYERCMRCEASDYCGICMGKFYSESGGDRFATSAFFCGVAGLTKRAVEQSIAQGSGFER